MAPSSAERPEYSTVTFSSCLLQWSLGSIAPVLLLVLLLLLCIHVKRKNRHFSTRPIEPNINASKLIRVTPLGDQSATSPEGKQPKAGRSVQEGGSLPSDPGAQAQRQTNGFTGNSRPQPGGSSPTKDLDSSPANRPGGRESRASAPGGPAAPQQNPTAPESVQFRELPRAPRNVKVTTVEHLGSSRDAYGPIYESIRDQGITGCRGRWCERSAGAAAGPNMNSGHATAGDPPAWASEGEESEPVATPPRRNDEQKQLVADHSSGDPGASPPVWQELAFEEDTANESLPEREKRLRALYARVCKKSRSPGHSQSASPVASPEPEEEEPPPLPEKHFDAIYETMSLLGSERQQYSPACGSPSSRHVPYSGANFNPCPADLGLSRGCPVHSLHQKC
ncbi:uncharacterized protein [Emydura macquarii macquarii]|uniref:uncharacterized protein n=1 Tax=Emydura macquarii macquarii TaxID=1129001 RepID=UPI00352B3322